MKIFNYILSFVLALFLMSCGDNDSDPVQEKNEFKIYWRHKDLAEYYEVQHDTLTTPLMIGEFFDLYFDTTLDTVIVTPVNASMTWVEHNKYRFRLPLAGEGYITYMAGDLDGNSQLESAVISFNVKRYIYIFLYGENSTYVVDTNDEDVKDEITNKLKEDRISARGNIIRLSFDSANQGTFTCTTLKKDPAGVFNFDESESITSISLLYDDSETILNIEGKAVEGYVNITRDLTDEYKAEYPTENINQVLIQSKVLCRKYPYQ